MHSGYEWFLPSFDLPGLVFRDLSDRLNLSRDEGEKWIVNLIRETRMGADAKIDLKKVRFFFPFLVSLYQLSDVIPSRTTAPGRAPSLVPVWAEESSPVGSIFDGQLLRPRISVFPFLFGLLLVGCGVIGWIANLVILLCVTAGERAERYHHQPTAAANLSIGH